MDYKTVYEKIKRENINDSTAKVYTLNLLNISKKYDLEFSEKMFNNLEVINKIKSSDLSDSTKKNKFNAIIAFLVAYNQPKDIIEQYRDQADILRSKIDRQNRKLEKSPKESKNWLTKEQLLLKLKELKDKMDKDKKLKLLDIEDYRKYIILLIHINIPLRNDLANSDIFMLNASQFKKEEMTNKKNYILISPKLGYIILNDFKTIKSKGVQKIKLDDFLLKEILKYYKFLKAYKKENNIDNNTFLIKDNGDSYTRNQYTKLFNTIFDKPISTTMIRKIIASDTWNIKAIQELSQKMQHTPAQALANYVKV